MAELVSDLRQALRFALRNPGFSAAAVLTLGLGIGATSAVFSVLNALTLRPLAYVDSARVCLLRAWDEARNRESFSMPLAAFVALAPQTPSFERVAAYRYWSAGLSGAGVPERAQGYRVTGDTFPLLGVAAKLGRTLKPEDAAPTAPKVVVLSHGLWQRRFASDPGVIGHSLRLDGEPYTVVGVMPARFEFPVYNFKGELWTPLPVDEAAALADPGASGSVVALGRLRKGGSRRAAEAEVRAAFLRHAATSPQTFRSLGVRVLPLQELGAGEARPPLVALLGAVLAVLLLGCANLAGLLLARGIARERELAVRLRGALVVGQVGISLVLLVGAGLALLSFRSLLAQETGFAPQRVLTMTASLPDERYPDPARRLAFFERVIARLAALPGVERAAAVNVLPFSTYNRGAGILLEGTPEPGPGEAARANRARTPGYLDALGM